MESECEVNPMPKKDNCESQSLKNQGNINGGRFFLFHQSSKPESTITSKTIKFESIESQDYCGRRSKIITRHGMLKVALSTFLILLIICTSLSIFLIMKRVSKNHNPSKESNADHASLTPEEFFKPGYQKLGLINEAFSKLRKIHSTEHAKIPYFFADDDENQTNIEYNDDHFIIQAIKQRKENGPCTFLIPGEIVKKYKISSWELNDGKDDPKCHEYNLNFGHGAPHHQYIHLKPSRCGSICDNTSHTLNNTIHLKVKYHSGPLLKPFHLDELNERSISFPISCKIAASLWSGQHLAGLTCS